MLVMRTQIKPMIDVGWVYKVQLIRQESEGIDLSQGLRFEDINFLNGDGAYTIYINGNDSDTIYLWGMDKYAESHGFNSCYTKTVDLKFMNKVKRAIREFNRVTSNL